MDQIETPRRRAAGVLHGMLAALVIAALSYILVDLYLRFGRAAEPPVIFHDARFLQAEASPGDSVELELDRTRTTYCPGVAAQVWVREGSNLLVNDAPASAGVTLKLGRHTTVFRKTLPPTIDTPGYWCYAPLLTYHCPYRAHTLMQPPACIRVVLKQPDASPASPSESAE